MGVVAATAVSEEETFIKCQSTVILAGTDAGDEGERVILFHANQLLLLFIFIEKLPNTHTDTLHNVDL